MEIQARRLKRQQQLDHVLSREMEAEERSNEVATQVEEIRAILRSVKDSKAPLNYAKLKKKAAYPGFDACGNDVLTDAPLKETFMPLPPGFFQSLFGGRAEYERKVAEADEDYARALDSHEKAERERISRLQELQANYRRTCDRIDRGAAEHNADVDRLKAGYEQHDRSAIVEYFSLVFEQDELPHGFPEETRVTFDTDSKQLVIERRLPVLSDMPVEAGFKFVKKSESIEPVFRKPTELRSMYADSIAQVSLRTLRLALAADTGESFAVISFNGFVDTIDPATGTSTKPTLISLTATRDALRALSFDNVDPGACLRNLKALVSRSAHELAPVRPLVSFDMIDRRFIDKTDVLTTLDNRPNLAELSPSEFESLMTNLFDKMGLETRLTQASRDGGVDCVAWDMRPVIGGKVIVQAKRYRHTVGVSAVRDLFGTMMNEGAAKGILVTTSGYGQSAYEFAKSKPIELVTGNNLLSMLAEYAHVEARIDFPDDWVDAAEAPEPPATAPAPTTQPPTATAEQ